MPTAGLTFRAGPATLIFDPAGRLVGAVPDAAPETSYLTSAGEVEVVARAGPLEWSPPRLSVDADELEITRQHADRLQVVVRHAFSSVWSVRVALTNLTAEPLTLDAVSLGWAAPAEVPVWALAAGAVGAYAVSGPDGGPVLGGTLALGDLAAVTPTTLESGPVTLAPAGRYVVQWQWDWYAHLKAFAHRPGGGHDRQVPRTLTLTVPEAALISAGADEALVLDARLAAEPVRDQTELVAYEPGTYEVELRSARGLTRYDLTWVAPVPELLVAAAETVLAGPRTPAGVVRLTGLDAALVVQFGLRAGLDDVEAGEDALDLFTARLGPAEELDPRAATFLCGEFDRTGDPELVQAATTVVGSATAVVPGLGLALGQVALARLVAGLPPLDRPPLDRSPLDRSPLDRSTSERSRSRSTVLASAVAALELDTLTLRATPDALAARVASLGGWLGGGLPGAPVRAVPLETAAHLAAVLAGLDEELSGRLRRWWPTSAHELGRWTEATVVERLGRSAVSSAHAWLAVAARTR